MLISTRLMLDLERSSVFPSALACGQAEVDKHCNHRQRFALSHRQAETAVRNVTGEAAPV